jgi:uncharacterized cupin superfamily protein
VRFDPPPVKYGALHSLDGNLNGPQRSTLPRRRYPCYTTRCPTDPNHTDEASHMKSPDRPSALLRASTIDAMQPTQRVHQFNSNAVRLTRTLGERVGMQRIGVHIVRLQPGHESTQFHYHDADEEFLYVLAGRGIAEIGDEKFEVGPGDFMGFTAPSEAHTLSNPFAEDLVYLMAGERNPNDVVHYPRIRRTMIKGPGARRWVDWDDLHEL